jgi:hypothetical protein
MKIKNIGKVIIVLFSGLILFILCIFCKILMKFDKKFEEQLKNEVRQKIECT